MRQDLVRRHAPRWVELLLLAVASAEELRSDATVAKVEVTADAKVMELPGRFGDAVGEPRPAADRGPPLPEMQVQEDEDFRLLRNRVQSDAWHPPDERSDSDAIGPGNALERRQTPWMTRRSWLRRQRSHRLARIRASAYERSDERRAWAARPPETRLSDARAPVEPQTDPSSLHQGQAYIGGYAQLRRKTTDFQSLMDGRAATEQGARRKFGDVNIDVIPVDPFCCGVDFDPNDDGSRGQCEQALSTHEKEYDPAKFDQYRSQHCGAGLAGLLAVAGLLCLRD